MVWDLELPRFCVCNRRRSWDTALTDRGPAGREHRADTRPKTQDKEYGALLGLTTGGVAAGGRAYIVLKEELYTPGSSHALTRSSGRGLVEQVDRRQDVVFVRLNDATVHNHLVQNEVRFLEVEHDVQLAHILKVAIECLDECVDELEDGEFILIFAFNANNEKEGRVTSIHDLVPTVLKEGALRLRA
eukprot:CAMPEP_0119375144 /NCGR_PEP_ID=MMETSP1334-20130426/33990_1 /TAXON_ID=127549 /ORGANISM="Calcidiscus leptoporus, Strain RCC1130" /LENGTH=187 /DNA_ID=CAMNT_0007393373 /DNA_START=184 /DNA_END=748 /DNA_ORIENTATION=-